MKQKSKEAFPIENGPLIVALDNMLKDMKVQREAYYGGTVTENHPHKCLKVQYMSKSNHWLSLTDKYYTHTPEHRQLTWMQFVQQYPNL